jgi:DNA polymerase-3 subunit beta
MKITLTKENIQKAVKKCLSLTTTNTSLPILSSVLLEAIKGELVLSVTNLESGLIVRSRASVEREGKVVVSFKILSGVISGLVSNVLTLEKSGNSLKISTDVFEAEIKINEDEEFPLIPQIKKENDFLLSPVTLSEAIKKVLPATAVSGMKPELTSVYLASSKDGLKVVATDGFRLIEVTLGKEVGKIDPIIIPYKTAQEAYKILSGIQGEDVCFYTRESQFIIAGSDFYWVSRVIDGHYPDYCKIIPQTKITEILFKKEDFLEAVRGAAIFANNETNDVVLDYSLKSGKVTVFAESQKTGKFSVKIDSKIEGKEGRICLNYRYLLDGLLCLESEEIIMLINQETSPVLLKAKKAKKESSVLCLISPIKKNNA